MLLISPDWASSLGFPLPGHEINRRNRQLSRPRQIKDLRTSNGLVWKTLLISKGKVLLDEHPLAMRGQSCPDIILSSDSPMIMLGRHTLRMILTVIFVIYVSDAPVITLVGGATSLPQLQDLLTSLLRR